MSGADIVMRISKVNLRDDDKLTVLVGSVQGYKACRATAALMSGYNRNFDCWTPSSTTGRSRAPHDASSARDRGYGSRIFRYHDGQLWPSRQWRLPAPGSGSTVALNTP